MQRTLDDGRNATTLPGLVQDQGAPAPLTHETPPVSVSQCPEQPPGRPRGGRPGQLTVTLNDKILFASGSAEMHALGHCTLEKIIGTLLSVPNKRINVSGYTDNELIGPARVLSEQLGIVAARSSDVLRFLQAQGINPNGLRHAALTNQPVDLNTTAAGRKENSRIEIVPTDKKF